MLLRSSVRDDIAGIIVTPGNTWAEAGQQHLMKVLMAAGIPAGRILVSAAGPLVNSSERAKQAASSWGVDYCGAFGHTGVINSPISNPAVTFLLETVHGNPGDVTILSLAPMTPIALAIRYDPLFAQDVGQVVMMGGAISGKGNATASAEFNVWFDPEAAKTVLQSGIRQKILFDLRACEQATLTRREFEVITRHDTALARLYRHHMGDVYPGFRSNPTASVPMWDALAAAHIIDPSIVKRFEKMLLDVEIEFGPTYGTTCRRGSSPSSDASAPTLVATEIDGAKALQLYCDLLGGADSAAAG